MAAAAAGQSDGVEAFASRQQQQHALALTVVWQLVLQPGIIHNVQKLGFCYLGEVHAAVAHLGHSDLVSLQQAEAGVTALGVSFVVVVVRWSRACKPLCSFSLWQLSAVEFERAVASSQASSRP